VPRSDHESGDALRNGGRQTMSRRHGAGGNARQVGRHFMEVVAIEDWVDRNSFTDEKTLKRRIVLVAVVLVMAGVVVGCLSFLTLASLAE
jgi:hypothetical protein